jgi:hypothetical protein
MSDGRLNLFGDSYTVAQLKDYVPDLSTIAGMRPYRLSDGLEKEVAAIDVWTGSGLEYTVLSDRGMSVCGFRYRGVPLDWSSGTGPVSPWRYDPDGWGWLRSFNGGLVHTCGLNNVGEPCVDRGPFVDQEKHGGHGRVSHTPASQVSWKVDMEQESYVLEVMGRCRSMAVQGENLLLERTIRSEIGGKRIVLQDRICNLGFNRTPVFLLYHCNFGFPLLSEASRLSLPARVAVDRSGRQTASFTTLGPPSDSPEEEVVYPLVEGDPVEITLFNPQLPYGGLGVQLKYRASELPHLAVWKFFQKRSYVLAIEPATCRVEGRVVEKEAGRAVYLEADEHLVIDLELRVMEGL